ncbi:hypothetical protein TcBrA4_0120340 [Trypanosoma cruzi]|nr:hypothetical protein TcBrA4_0120340 [Trypanosoma cruzi]
MRACRARERSACWTAVAAGVALLRCADCSSLNCRVQLPCARVGDRVPASTLLARARAWLVVRGFEVRVSGVTFCEASVERCGGQGDRASLCGASAAA